MTNELVELEAEQVELLPERDAMLALGLIAVLGLTLDL